MFDIVPYDSGHSSELAAAIPVTKGAPWSQVALFRLNILNVKIGDILDIKAYGQITNDIAPATAVNNTMFCHQIRAGVSKAETIEISEARGVNVNRQRHHETWEINTFYKATADYANLSIAVFAYAASTAVKSGWKLTVDKDFGRLQVLHFKKAPVV